MKNILKALLTLAVIALLSYHASAQPGFDDDVQDTPLDGGIALVVGSALAYGAMKKRKK
ncbi:MAG: hypothetical protein ACK4K9_08890 [Bacteroidia bacterium]